MKKFVFIVTDRNRIGLHVGISSDVKKTMAHYSNMPSLLFDSGSQLTRLVYFEELNTEGEALVRFNLLSKYTRVQKERLIRQANANWVDLASRLEIESGYYSRVPASQASHLRMQ